MISIRRQLTRELLAAVLLLLAAGLGGVYWAAQDIARDQFDTALQAKARAISTLTFQTGNSIRVDFNDRFMHGFEDRKPRDFFQLWAADGHEIDRSESLLAGGNLPRSVGTLAQPRRWNFKLPSGRPGRAVGFVFRPRTTDEAARAAPRELQLVVASDREELDEALWQLLALCGVFGVLLAATTTWLIPRVLRRGLKPLEELGQQVTRIDSTSLATRMPTTALPAEVQPIAHRLNELLGRLEQSFERERRFSADLAHELRTPLAELHSMAECAIKWPESRDPNLDQEVVAIARQMEQIVTNILALVRGEQGQLEAQPEMMSVGPLIAQTWERYVSRATERNIRAKVAIEADEGLADPALLRSILNNLFDNAVEYTPMGGAIEIAARREEESWSITIANTAADLDPTDVAKMFDRFWRKEAARSGGLHVGLGLSLSRAFAEAMGWTLTAALETDHRLVFRLKEQRTARRTESSRSPAEVTMTR